MGMRCWLAALVVTVFLPSPASACGGLFCGGSRVGTVAINQNAERVIFAVSDEGTTMIVQVQWRGPAAEFAWVLPLGVLPEPDGLDIAPVGLFDALDAVTAPRVAPCPGPSYQRLAESTGPMRNRTSTDVRVHAEEIVGPYEAVVVEAAAVDPLVIWLEAQGFAVTEAMVPRMETYVFEGASFLALRLRAGAEVGDIEPLRIRFPPGATPTLPLRMTAVAAEPEMPIRVYILGDERYGPANGSEIEVDLASVAVTPEGRSNWSAIVAWGADRATGPAWLTEAAVPVDEIRDSLERAARSSGAENAMRALLWDPLFLTRLATRASADEMDVDPSFRRDGLERVWFGTLYPRCSDEPCLFATCGRHGRCTPIEAGARSGCTCDADATARTMRDERGQMTVTCVDPSAAFRTPPVDPCADIDCGAGECVPAGLVPSCRCDRGAVAGVFDGGVRCIGGETSETDAGVRVGPPPRTGCRVRPDDPRRDIAWHALAFALGLLLVRRRRSGARRSPTETR